MTRRMAMVAAAAIVAAVAVSACAEDALRRSKFVNLGMFAGYVVACGVASAADAEAMARRVGAGLGEPWPAEAGALFENARAAGLKSKCPKELKDAVERGWRNYSDVR